MEVSRVKERILESDRMGRGRGGVTILTGLWELRMRRRWWLLLYD